MYKLTILPVVLAVLLLAGCPQPTDNTVAAGPALAAKGSQLAINQSEKTLTVGFNTSVDLKDKTKVDVYKGRTRLAEGKIAGMAVNKSNTRQIVITLNDPILKADAFHVVVDKDAITDLSGNKPAGTLTTETKSLSSDKTAPALAALGSQLAINQAARTLTVGFSELVKITDAAQVKNRIEVHKGSTKLAASKITSIALKQGDATKIVITLNDPILKADSFHVVIPVNAITDQNGNKPANPLTTETLSLSSDTTGPALAALGSQLAIDDTARTLTVVFSEPVKITNAATIKTRIKVYKGSTELAASKIAGIAVKQDDATKIVITLSDPILRNDAFRVVVNKDAITDQNDNKPAGTLTTETVFLSSDTTAPALAALGSQLVVDDTARTLTVVFSEPVKITDAAQVKTRIEVHKGGTKLAASKIAGIAVKQDDATRMVITLVDAFQVQDKFKVVIPRNAITDRNDNKPAGTLTTETRSADKTKPALKTSGGAGNYLAVDRAAKTLAVTFSEAISIKDAARIVVKKNGGSLTSGDIASRTVTGAGNDKILITLETAPEAGDALQVVFEAGAVEDLNGNPNDKLETEVESEPPQLAAGGDVLTVRTGSRTLEIEFNQPLKAIDASKIKVYKTPAAGTKAPVPSSKITSIGLKTGDATRVQIVLADAMAKDDKYQVDFLKDAATGTNDKKNPGTLSTETDTLGVVDNRAPTLGYTLSGKLLLVSNAGYKFGLGLRVSFNEYIARFDASQIEVYFDGARNPLNASTIETVYLSDFNRLVLVLKKASSTHGRYQVKLKANAVFDAADNGNTETLSTETDTLDFMVRGMVVNASAKTLTLDFSKDITDAGAVDAYEVYKNSDSSVRPASAAVSADNGKNVILTLSATVRAADRFYVRVISGRVTAAGGGKNAVVGLETGLVSEGAVRDTTAPRLKSSGNIAVVYKTTNLSLYLSFDEPLSFSHKSLSKNLVVNRDGEALPGNAVQSFFQSSSKKLGIVLKPAASLHGNYRVQVLSGLVQDVAGNANARGTSGTPAVHFVPTGHAFSGGNTLTLSFSKAITGILKASTGFFLYKDSALHGTFTKTVTARNGKIVIGSITVASGDVFRLWILADSIEAGTGNKNMQIETGNMVAP